MSGGVYAWVCCAASSRVWFVDTSCRRAGRGTAFRRRREYRKRRPDQNHLGRTRPSDDVVVGNTRPADESRTAVERRFRLSDTNPNAALKSMGGEANA